MHEDEDEEEVEVDKPRVCVNPGKPSREDVEEREVTHIPFRRWCLQCVRGRGQASPHPKGKESPESKLPTLALDYGFLGEADRKKMTSLVIRDGRPSAIHGFLVSQKGVSDERVARRIANWIDRLGYRRAVIKSDQEPAIEALRNEISKLCIAELVPEFSPVKDSKSNGLAENAVKESARMIRTLKDQVEGKIGEQLREDEVLMTWIVDYAGMLITRVKKGSDGKTAYQRLKGKSPGKQVAMIGERVLYMPIRKSSSRLNKLEPKFKYGIWLGVSGRTSESLIGASDGVFKARVVRRLEESKRWSAEYIRAIKGTPWDPAKGENVEVNLEENPGKPQ